MRREPRDRTYLAPITNQGRIEIEFDSLLSDLDGDLLDTLETRDLSDAEFLARDDAMEW